MAAAVQVGDAVKVSFGSYSWTGFIPENGLTNKEGYNETEIVKDLDGATVTKIRMDGYEQVQGTFILDSAVASIVLNEGDVVSITSPNGTTASFEVTDASTAFAAGATKLTCTLIKEASMTYTS